MKLLVEVNVDETQIESLNEKRARQGRQTTTAFDMVDNAISSALAERWVKNFNITLPPPLKVNTNPTPRICDRVVER